MALSQCPHRITPLNGETISPGPCSFWCDCFPRGAPEPCPKYSDRSGLHAPPDSFAFVSNLSDIEPVIEKAVDLSRVPFGTDPLLAFLVVHDLVCILAR